MLSVIFHSTEVNYTRRFPPCPRRTAPVCNLRECDVRENTYDFTGFERTQKYHARLFSILVIGACKPLEV